MADDPALPKIVTIIAITCPVCHLTSYNPNDIREGYCANCHDWTFDFSAEGGVSVCPICGRQWHVSPVDDCMVPACGCFGHDVFATNPYRPCEYCGVTHARECEKMPR
jgi:hypothetical protein